MGTVLLMGYGEMGHAQEFLLRTHHEILIWQRRAPIALAPAVTRAQAVVLCVPTEAIADTLALITPHLAPALPVASVAKGLDARGHYAAQIMRETLPAGQAWAVIYGPMIAEELLAGHYGFAQAGCNDATTYSRLREVYAHSRLKLEYSADVTGMSWAVTMKNVYAILFGAADELRLGDNMRGLLAVQALREVARIVTERGGDAITAYQLAGVGDLITTATSDDSHHHELGRRLARGERDDIRGEGVHTLRMLMDAKLLDFARYPLAQVSYRLVHEGGGARELFENYIEREFAVAAT